MSRAERVQAVFFALLVAVVNALICWRLFKIPSAHMNSMHGFWAALARWGGDSWLHPSWWPYWDCGIPFEYTYAPLVPVLTSFVSWCTGRPLWSSVDIISALVYCLGPVTFFVMAWRLTRAPLASFAAALLYSLTAPELLVMPDSWLNFLSPRRLILMGQWDDTPHFLALAILPLAILGLTFAIQTRRLFYIAATALAIAIMTYASAFGPVLAALAAICLVATLGKNHVLRSLMTVAIVGVWAYAISAAFLPPSLLRIIHASASPYQDSFWTLRSFTGIGVFLGGGVLAGYLLNRWTRDWRVQFFWLFTYLTCVIPMLAAYAHIQFLPQPERYKIEAGFGLALVMAFTLRGWMVQRGRIVIGVALAVLALLAVAQVHRQRVFARGMWPKSDATQTVEYRASTWIAANLPGVRVFLPGTIAQWANTFTDIRQFTGGSWSMAYNRAQIKAFWEILYAAPDAAITWLRAFGVGAIAVSDANSAEYWKPFSQPGKFEGLLPVLWRAEGVTIYQIPGASPSLAHVIPADASVSLLSAAQLLRYDSAISNPAAADVSLSWQDRNSILLRTVLYHGQSISLQMNQHAGWRAAANGKPCPIQRDQLGLMLLTPPCNGPCEVSLSYDGGLEIQAARLISSIALLASLLCLTLAIPFRLF